MGLKRVLVADDHEVTRRGLREILSAEHRDLEIHDAEDFHGVLRLVQAHAFDLLLLDIRMPGPSNVTQVVRQLRDTLPGVPILMFTASMEMEHVFAMMRAGANGVVHKHRAADDLLDAVRCVTAGGDYMHPETALEVARALREPEPKPVHQELSAREMEIFCLIAKGRSIKEIAGDLSLSDKTVATYLARIREKTGLTSHVDIARYALQHGLVD